MADYELRHLARPYAKAAFEYACAGKDFNAWSEMLQFMKFVIKEPPVAAMLKNPFLDKQQLLDWLFALKPTLWNQERQQFLRLLAENHRIALLPEIADLFASYRADHEKTVEVEVQSAFILNAEQRDRLKPILKVFLQRDVELKCTEDARLLGGFIARAGDWVMDASLRGRLNALRDQIKQ